MRQSSRKDEPRPHPDVLRLQVVVLFFAGLLFLVLLAVGIGLAAPKWTTFRLGWLNYVFGPFLAIGGFSLVVWSVRIQYTLGRGTPAPKVATQRLVIEGPYSYTRNPMTLGALLMYLGIGVWMGSGVVILLTLVVFAILLRYIYIHETHELSERFGEEYLDYKNRTPFLLPHVRRPK